MAKAKRRGRPSYGERGEEDGADPRRFFDRRQRGKAPRKALQLCAQVAEALNYALPADGDDEVRNALVEAVEPFPNSARMLVTVRPSVGAGDPQRMLAALAAAAGRLRMAVAAAITRKRTPELFFRMPIDPSAPPEAAV